MKRKIVIPLVVITIVAVLVIALVFIFLQPSQGPDLETGSRKAIILCSANDFYRNEGEPDFNEGNDGKFENETSTWADISPGGGFIVQDTLPGHDGLPGLVHFISNTWPNPNGSVNLEFVYNWTNYYPLYKYAMYYLSAWVNIPTQIFTTPGARVGLRWLNSSNDVIRTDWSGNLTSTFGLWYFVNVTGIADNLTSNEITQLHLVLSVKGNMTTMERVFFDDVRVEYWFPPPMPSPPPSNTNTDGFPAQALQVYWILKNHGYTDENIFLMLYHTGDSIIDINASDGIPNDLVGTVIDVENNDVNTSRFKRELDVSISGSFASGIQTNDELIIFITDHGSNKVLSDGNATFHFEADDSYITEVEFYNLVKQINCARMLINIDMCFSGNFLNENANIGFSWYNIPNSILITSTTDILSWYWRDNNNADGFAGSWFFHQFWGQINQSQTVGDAFNYAKNFVPSGQVKSINDIQSPLIQDNLGINNTWHLTNSP